MIEAFGPIEGRVVSIFEQDILADRNINVLRESCTAGGEGWNYFLTFSGRKYFEIRPNTIDDPINLSIIDLCKEYYYI